MVHVSVQMMHDTDGVNRYLLTLSPARKGRSEQQSLDDVNNSYDYKLAQSISRTRSLAIGYALSNGFEYFCTFTFNKECIDRYSLEEVKKKLTKFFNNYKRKSPDFAYIVVPEPHEDGAWHFHGVCKGIIDLYEPETILCHERSGDQLSPLIEVPNRNHYLRWKSYKFGHFDCSPIKSKCAVSNYFSSYLTKFIYDKFPVGSKVLLKSNGLKKPTLLHSFDALYGRDWGSVGLDLGPLYELAYTKGSGVYLKQYEFATTFCIEATKTGSVEAMGVAESCLCDYLRK